MAKAPVKKAPAKRNVENSAADKKEDSALMQKMAKKPAKKK